MSPEMYLKIIRRYWLALIVAVIISGLVGYGAAQVLPKTYSADSSGFITTPGTADAEGSNAVSAAMAGDSYAKSRAKSYADLGKKRVVAEDAIKDLGWDVTPESLVSRVEVTVPTGTVTLKVTARGSTPEQARDLANAWIRAMSQEIKVLESSGGGTATVELASLESADLPSSPISPNATLYTAVGALLGLFAGLGYALIRSRRDLRIRSAQDVTSLTEHPIVGTLPLEKDLAASEGRLSTEDESQRDVRQASNVHHLNEALRELRTNLEFLDVDHPPRSIVVTSALPGDGKSTVAANLATMIAASGQQVVLIDGDLRKPTVARTFSVPGEIGLTDVLAGRTELAAVVHPWSSNDALSVLPSGSIPPNPTELLGSQNMRELVESLTEEGMIVIIDAPPILPVTDAAVLAAKCDGSLVVASAGQTRTDSLEQALERVEAVHGRILGVVLNRVPTKGMDKYSYGYYRASYYYQEDDGKSGKKSRRRRSRAAAAES